MAFYIDHEKTSRAIKELCDRRGIKARRLSEDLDIGSPQAVHKWFSGTTIPGIDNLILLAYYLNVRTDDIIRMYNDETPFVLSSDMFDSKTEIIKNTLEASKYDAQEDAIRLYLEDYIKRNRYSFAIAIFKDAHCLVTGDNIKLCTDDNEGNVFRINSSDEGTLMSNLIKLVRFMKDKIKIDNIMFMAWHQDSDAFPEGFSKIVLQKKDNQWTFIEPY